MAIDSEILNAAMHAFIQTFPMRDRLDSHIKRFGLGAQQQEITSELDAVVKFAEDYLWAFQGGVNWDDAFVSGYRKLLLARHAWLDAESIDRILAFSQWLCWHEGLYASRGV